MSCFNSDDYDNHSILIWWGFRSFSLQNQFDWLPPCVGYLLPLKPPIFVIWNIQYPIICPTLYAFWHTKISTWNILCTTIHTHATRTGLMLNFPTCTKASRHCMAKNEWNFGLSISGDWMWISIIEREFVSLLLYNIILLTNWGTHVAKNLIIALGYSNTCSMGKDLNKQVNLTRFTVR